MGTNYYWIKEKMLKIKEIHSYLSVKREQDLKWFNKKGYPIERDPDYFYSEAGYFWHIGKISSAGSYCYDCHISGNEGGDEGSRLGGFEQHHRCPICGKDMNSACRFTYYDFNRDNYLLNLLRENNEALIVDEYGEEFTVKKFLEDVTEKSPVVFHSHELFS